MVKSQTILETVKQARSASTKRQFKQSFELVINLKDIDVKKNQINLNETVFLPNPPQNKSKVCVKAQAGGFITKQKLMLIKSLKLVK